MALSWEQLEKRRAFSAAFRKDIDGEAAGRPNDDNTLWKTARLLIWNISRRYKQPDPPMELFAFDLHDLWYTIIQAAKTISADHPSQDRLISQILYARELGTLVRNTEPPNATFSYGRIWTDLPFLIDDLQLEWRQLLQMSAAHRHNLAAFTARLVALGVCSNALSVCALWTLRETLETPRNLTVAENTSNVSISEMLPAAVVWLSYSSHKLIALSNTSSDALDLETATLGELAKDANVTSGGFNRSRWRFWRHRLEEIGQCDQEQAAQLARRGVRIMKERAKDVDVTLAED